MEVFYIVINAIRFILLALNLTGNSLVLLTIFKVKSLQGPTTYSLMNLAFLDLSFGCFIVFGHAVSNLYGENESNVKSESSSRKRGSVPLEFYLRALITSWTLVAIAIERYLAVVKPFYHRVHVNKKALLKTFISLWIVSAFLAIPGVLLSFYQGPEGLQLQARNGTNFSFLNNSFGRLNHSDSSYYSTVALAQIGYEVFLGVLCTVLPAFLMGYFYGRIIYSVWFKPASQQGTNMGILKARRKLTKLLLTVIVVFYLCWMPLFAVLVGHVSDKAKMVCVLFPLLSTTVNPVIYSLHSKPFRQGIKSLFVCCCSKKKVGVKKSTVDDVPGRTRGCCCYRSWTVFRGNGNTENTGTTREVGGRTGTTNDLNYVQKATKQNSPVCPNLKDTQLTAM